MAFGIRDRQISLGVLAALAFYGASWGWWGLSPHSNEGLLPGWVDAWVVVLLTAVGAGILIALALRTIKDPARSIRSLQIAFIGLLLGMVMVAVVQKEPGNFYSVSAGVMASLILALAAGAMIHE